MYMKEVKFPQAPDRVRFQIWIPRYFGLAEPANSHSIHTSFCVGISSYNSIFACVLAYLKWRRDVNGIAQITPIRLGQRRTTLEGMASARATAACPRLARRAKHTGGTNALAPCVTWRSHFRVGANDHLFLLPPSLPPSLSISLPSEWLQISRGSSVFPFPSLKRRLGPDSMENNCLQCCLEKLLEIPFLFCDMSKLSIFQLFLSVGNLTPEHKCFFLAKLKSPLFQLNRAPDRRTQTDTCGGHAILCLGPLSLNSPKGFSTFCAWNFHFVTD